MAQANTEALEERERKGAWPSTIPYVSIVASEGKRVILPLAAAQNSKLIDNLVRSLVLCSMLKGKAAAAVSGSSAHAGAGAEAAAAAAGKEEEEEEEKECERGESVVYHNMASRTQALLPSLPLGSAGSGEGYALRVPLPCLEFPTLDRVASFLVQKTHVQQYSADDEDEALAEALVGGGGERLPFAARDADIEVFRDLDPSRPKDRIIATQVLLESDFLNC